MAMNDETIADAPAKAIPNLNGIHISKQKSGTILIPLPCELWRPIEGGCCCEYCSSTERVSAPAFWDTLVVDPVCPYTWVVHNPAINGVKPRRIRDAKVAAARARIQEGSYDPPSRDATETVVDALQRDLNEAEAQYKVSHGGGAAR